MTKMNVSLYKVINVSWINVECAKRYPRNEVTHLTSSIYFQRLFSL